MKDNVCDTFETRGKYPSSSVCFNEYVVSGNNSSLRLRARVFNNRVAFRYEWTEEVKKAPSLNISEEKTSFAFPEKTVLWTQDASSALGPCEGVWSPSRITDFKKIPAIPAAVSAPCRLRRNCRWRRRAHTGSRQLQQAMERHQILLQDGACHTVYFQDPGGFSALILGNALARHPGE
ncbi:MAG: glycoside hydrolase family 97 N-terminal domain-containing protein [Akkermansia sp.]